MSAPQPIITTPTRRTVNRLPQKRSRQQGRLLLVREVTDLLVRPPLVPSYRDDAIFVRKDY